MLKKDSKPKTVDSISGADAPESEHFEVWTMVDISIDPELSESGVEQFQLDGAKDDLKTALDRLDRHRAKMLQSITISGRLDLTIPERPILNYSADSDEMLEDLRNALQELKPPVPAQKSVEPEPAQMPEAVPEPALTAPEGEKEEGGKEVLLRESRPEIYKNFISSDAWRQGDSQSRDALAGRLLETLSSTKPVPEKSEQPSFASALEERFPQIYEKLKAAKGWNLLHSNTREAIAAGFMGELNVTDSEWVERVFEDKYKDIVLDIKATQEQLQQSDLILTASYVKEGDLSGKRYGTDVRADSNGNIIIPVSYDKNANSDENSLVGKIPTLSPLIPDAYTSEWSSGKLFELQAQYPAVHGKLIAGEHWDELSPETKDTVAEAFFQFLKKYPERQSMISGVHQYSFVVSKGALKSLTKNEPVLLWRLEYSSEKPEVVSVMLGSADEYHEDEDFTFRRDREEYLKHVVNTLRGIH